MWVRLPPSAHAAPLGPHFLCRRLLGGSGLGMMKPTMEDEKTQRGASKAWLIVAVVVAVLILGDLNRRMADARRLERDAVRLTTQVVDLERTNQALATDVAQATSDLMVEEWARSEARMVQEGESLIVPVPVEGMTPEPTATPVDTRRPPSNWEVWWALLFGR